ncbi:MAG: type II toxin-antitoxin system PemK/MazF family toxin [Gemmatimonadota bacterium]|nr:type II toxin-antitoxin system PemK/MazF family toxin [Gemmatimonadota bacterium]
MPASELYDSYDVVVVPFPYADRLAEKRRPALVVSSQALSSFRLMWVAMITSAANDPWSCDVPIGDLEQAGLPAPSVVRPAKIACIDPTRVLRRAGTLEPTAARKVDNQLRAFLATASPKGRK